MLNKDSSDNSLPDFDSLANQFLQAGALGSPAELHGCLCGHLAAGGRFEGTDWLVSAATMLELGSIEQEELAAALQRLYQVSLGQLSGGDFDFVLLMPDEDAAMTQRAEALGQWCQGFISGYGMAGGSVDGLGEDARDALQDMVQISQIAIDQEEDDGDEADFTEVYEYVRMSSLLIYSECNAPAPEQGAPADAPLH